jgi:hypothetical protein
MEESVDYVKDATPFQVLMKFGNHKLAKGKCLIERDALKLCVVLHETK